MEKPRYLPCIEAFPIGGRSGHLHFQLICQRLYTGDVGDIHLS
ncbi:hypothetical protein ACFPFV_01515 [Salinicoccus siamensis]